jgi:cytochrome c556
MDCFALLAATKNISPPVCIFDLRRKSNIIGTRAQPATAPRRGSGFRRAIHHNTRSDMHKTATFIASAAIALTLAANASAQVKPEDQIKYRKAAYSFASWNMGKIKASLEGTYDAAQVKAAANAIAVVAGSGLGSLFGPGTEKSIGDQKTSVKPELFQNGAEVGKLAGNFATAAAALVKAAESGDAATVRPAFGEVGKTCKACHDQFKSRN